MSRRVGKRCVFIDTNILTDALYGKYIPGKSDPFKSMVTTQFDDLLLEVLKSRGAKIICLSRFQLDVELERAAINAVMRKGPNARPEDLLVLHEACKSLREMFEELSTQGYAVIVDYLQPRVPEVSLRLYARCKDLGMIGRGRDKLKVGTQDFILIASLYFLLESGVCASLELWTADEDLHKLLQEISKQCQHRSHKYAFSLVFYDKNAVRRGAPQQLYICTDL